jgi:hypothetical protein
VGLTVTKDEDENAAKEGCWGWELQGNEKVGFNMMANSQIIRVFVWQKSDLFLIYFI